LVKQPNLSSSGGACFTGSGLPLEYKNQ